MSETGTVKRLAAVLALDVVGFSALMNQDEMGTLRRVQALQKEIAAPLVEQNRGRIFKLIGDGILADFSSINDAFTCATGIVQGLEYSDPDLKIRIGLHIGELIFDDGDVFGEGVNIAARLEGTAKPGTIAVSSRAWNELGKIHDNFEDLGEISLKNIKEPVRVYLYDPNASAKKIRFLRNWRKSRTPLAFSIGLGILTAMGVVFWQYYYNTPERVATRALADFPCSWLGLRRVAYVNDVPILEIEGGAVDDRSSLRRKLTVELAKESRQSVGINLDSVGQFPKEFCEFSERFKDFRYDGPPRLILTSVSLSVKQPPGLTLYDLNYRIYPETYQKNATIFGLEEGGHITRFASVTEFLDQFRHKDSEGAEDWTIVSSSNHNTGVLIIDSSEPIPEKILEDGKLDPASLNDLYDAAKKGKWKAEMVWGRPPDPKSQN